MRLSKEEAQNLGIVIDANGRASINRDVRTNAVPSEKNGGVAPSSSRLRGNRNVVGRNPQRMIFDEVVARLGRDQVVWEQRSLIPGRDFRADIFLPASMVVVEMDGFQYHRSKDAFQNDRVRQNLFVAQGYAVLRYFASQVFNDLAAVADQIERLHLSRVELLGELKATPDLVKLS
jgi:very-short-patch-repair endonuclease